MQNQPLDENQLQALLRLKRYEQPPAGYFDNLLDRVHRRQREELLSRSAWQIALDRIRAFFAPLQMGWRHAGAMAALLVAGIFTIRVAIPERVADPSQFAQTFACPSLPASDTDRMITLQPNGGQPLTSQVNRRIQRDPGAPVRFIIDAQPVSYETIQSSF